MNHKMTIICSALVWLASSAPILAEEPKPAHVPFDKPGPVHQQLGALAGDWDVEVRYRLAPDMERKGEAKCKAQWVLDGLFLKEEYKTNFQGTPFTVVQYLGYDNNRKKFLEMKIDNMHSGAMNQEGQASDDGKVFTTIGDSLDERGKPIQLKCVRTVQDRDHHTLEWFHIGPDGRDDKRVSMAFTRVK